MGAEPRNIVAYYDDNRLPSPTAQPSHGNSTQFNPIQPNSTIQPTPAPSTAADLFPATASSSPIKVNQGQSRQTAIWPTHVLRSGDRNKFQAPLGQGQSRLAAICRIACPAVAVPLKPAKIKIVTPAAFGKLFVPFRFIETAKQESAGKGRAGGSVKKNARRS
jgi:hypothetical protein